MYILTQFINKQFKNTLSHKKGVKNRNIYNKVHKITKKRYTTPKIENI